MKASHALVAVVALAAMAASSRAQDVDSVMSAVKVVYSRDNAPAAPKPEDLPIRQSVSRYGITWTFEEPARVGRFVNGDWYVVGPVTVKMIDPKPLWGDEVTDAVDNKVLNERKLHAGKLARNGSTLNLPAMAPRTKTGGPLGAAFDSRIPANRYDPEQFTPLPIHMRPGDSLTSSVSYKNDEIKEWTNRDNVEPVKRVAILTCLAEPVPADAFRPSYSETAGSKIYLARNLRRDLLASLAPAVPRDTPKLAETIRSVECPWIDVVDFGFASPKEHFPGGDYGNNMANTEGVATLMLLLNFKPEEKEPLLISMVQMGIDFWGLVRGGRSWHAWGGHFSGRKWPIIFAGVMLDDKDMQSPRKLYPDLHFQEDDQTAMCPVEYHGKVYEKGWTGAKAVFMGHSTEASGGGAKFRPDCGPTDLFPPSEWSELKKEWKMTPMPGSENYRRCCTSNGWVGIALAMRIMHMEKPWDHDAFLAYADRWMTEDDGPIQEKIKKAFAAEGAKVVTPFPRYNTQGYTMSAFVKGMWTAYRNNLPPAPDGHKDPPAEETWK